MLPQCVAKMKCWNLPVAGLESLSTYTIIYYGNPTTRFYSNHLIFLSWHMYQARSQDFQWGEEGGGGKGCNLEGRNHNKF